MSKNLAIAAGAGLGLVALIGYELYRKQSPVPSVTPIPAATFFDDVRVFDGSKVWPKADVLVQHGKIVAIAEQLDTPVGANRIAAAGHTLLPGLIDSHVHAYLNARRDALRFGVTTVMDMFSDARQLPAARAERLKLSATDQSDQYSAGTLATVAGGHGTQFGLPVPTLADAAEVAPWVAARKAEGSDYIKFVVEDLSAYGLTRRIPTLQTPIYAPLIAAAHAAGLAAYAHVSTEASARAVVEAKVDGLVHVFSDTDASPEFLSAAKQAGIFVVPTLSVVQGVFAGSDQSQNAPRITALLEHARVKRMLSGEQRGSVETKARFGAARNYLQTALANTHALKQAGVPILAGSDAPNPGTAQGRNQCARRGFQT
jgi:imidazolonepropionase-like amidohydrolase